MWRSYPGAGVLVVRDELVLMVLHERDGVYRWELPSGVVDFGESFEQTATRETVEETGIHAAVGELLCTVVIHEPSLEYRSVNTYFRAKAPDDAVPQANTRERRISSVAFMDLAQLRSREIHPVDRRILNMWRRKPDRGPYHIHITL
jgi:8-oxo-dGTP diphosphatase